MNTILAQDVKPGDVLIRDVGTYLIVEMVYRYTAYDGDRFEFWGTDGYVCEACYDDEIVIE